MTAKVTLSFTDETIEEARRFAKREGLSMSDALGLLTYNCLTAEGRRKNWFSLESMGDYKNSNSISYPDTK